MKALASYSDPVSKIKTKGLMKLVERDTRIVAFTIESDGVFIYTDAKVWCDDAGAGTFRGDTETKAAMHFLSSVRETES